MVRYSYTLFLVLPKTGFIYERRDVRFSIPLAVGMTINLKFERDHALPEHILEVAGIHGDERTGVFSVRLLVPLGVNASHVHESVASAHHWRSWELDHEPQGFPPSWRPKKPSLSVAA